MDCSNFSSSSVRDNGRWGCTDCLDIFRVDSKHCLGLEAERLEAARLKTRGEHVPKRCVFRAGDKGSHGQVAGFSKIRQTRSSKLLPSFQLEKLCLLVRGTRSSLCLRRLPKVS